MALNTGTSVAVILSGMAKALDRAYYLRLPNKIKFCGNVDCVLL